MTGLIGDIVRGRVWVTEKEKKGQHAVSRENKSEQILNTGSAERAQGRR